MKVKELIEKLQQLDPELAVVVSGYEGGYDDMNAMAFLNIARNVNDAWYSGDHAEWTTDKHANIPCEMAVELGHTSSSK